MDFYKPLIDLIKFQSKNVLPQTREVFKALVDGIIPNTPELAEINGSIHYEGALDLYTHEYEIWELNHNISLKILFKNFNIYIANATAEMLNIAAEELINLGENKKPINPDIGPEVGMFPALASSDRFRAISLLEHLKVDLGKLPLPFHNNSGFVLAVTSMLTLLATFGYYSEWPGYGSTGLESVEKRKMENFPASWKQVGYPGPSEGHHALRGYLIDEFAE